MDAFAIALNEVLVDTYHDAMNITRPTATVAINKLEKRGYLEKKLAMKMAEQFALL